MSAVCTPTDSRVVTCLREDNVKNNCTLTMYARRPTWFISQREHNCNEADGNNNKFRGLY